MRNFTSLSPARTAFILSLLLSLVAVWSNPVLNRDGMLYVEWAGVLLERGTEGLHYHKSSVLLAFLPLCIAALGKLTGLGLESAAHLLDALLLAGTCALMVAIVERRLPAAAWMACLAVLAMPAFNAHRNEVLREYGFWFFSVLAFWLALRREEAPRWRDALACQCAIAIAALFRTEAVVFYAALAAWQWGIAPAGQRLRRIVLFTALPLAGALLVLLVFASGAVPVPHRLGYYLDVLNPLRKLDALAEAGRKMAEAAFRYKYSNEEAGYILFFGLLSIIPVKFLQLHGVLAVPLLAQFAAAPLRSVLQRWQPLSWAFACHTAVLVVFVTHSFFLTGRYVSMLNLLAVPLVAAGLLYLVERLPRWHYLIVGLAVLTALANVISTSGRKTHITEAGAWLRQQATAPERIYVENPRTSYYGGLGYLKRPAREKLDRDALAAAVAAGRFDIVVLESDRKDAATPRWLAAQGLDVAARFESKGGDLTLIVTRGARQGD